MQSSSSEASCNCSLCDIVNQSYISDIPDGSLSGIVNNYQCKSNIEFEKLIMKEIMKIPNDHDLVASNAFYKLEVSKLRDCIFQYLMYGKNISDKYAEPLEVACLNMGLTIKSSLFEWRKHEGILSCTDRVLDENGEIICVFQTYGSMFHYDNPHNINNVLTNMELICIDKED